MKLVNFILAFFYKNHLHHTYKDDKYTKYHYRNVERLKDISSNKGYYQSNITDHCTDVVPKFIIMMPFLHISEKYIYVISPKHINGILNNKYNIKLLYNLARFDVNFVIFNKILFI